MRAPPRWGIAALVDLNLIKSRSPTVSQVNGILDFTLLPCFHVVFLDIKKVNLEFNRGLRKLGLFVESKLNSSFQTESAVKLNRSRVEDLTNNRLSQTHNLALVESPWRISVLYKSRGNIDGRHNIPYKRTNV